MKTIIITIALVLASCVGQAQLRGSGNTVTKTFAYTNFDKIYFEDLDGKVAVEVGKTWSITVTIDDNLASLLSVRENASEHELTVSLAGNKNNRMYIEDTNINIKITLPEASVIRNDSNASLIVTGVLGRYFRLENKDNASTTVLGTIDELEVKNTGNGNADLTGLQAQKATIVCRGNGNVTVNVSEKITASVSGNGNITNLGKAPYDSQSSRSGNGNLITNP